MHTVIGFHRSTFEAFARVIKDEHHWAAAAQCAVEQGGAGDEQIVAVLPGEHQPVGTAENLPNCRPSLMNGEDAAVQAGEFTVIGFDETAQDAVVQYPCVGRGWMRAVWRGVKTLGSAAGSYHFVAAFKGPVMPAGTWHDFVQASNQVYAAERGAQRRAAR